MRRISTIGAAIAVAVGSGCGSNETPDAVGLNESTATVSETTEPPTTELPTTELPTTTEVPADGLEAAVESCADDAGAAADAQSATELAAQNGPATYRNITKSLAEENSMTVDQWYAKRWAETFTLDSDGAITISGAFQTYDTDEDELYWDRITQLGAFSGVALQCLITTLYMPTSFLSRIRSMTAIDGVQSEKWDGYEARWSYHPTSGMEITIWESE